MEGVKVVINANRPNVGSPVYQTHSYGYTCYLRQLTALVVDVLLTGLREHATPRPSTRLNFEATVAFVSSYGSWMIWHTRAASGDVCISSDIDITPDVRNYIVGVLIREMRRIERSSLHLSGPVIKWNRHAGITTLTFNVTLIPK